LVKNALLPCIFGLIWLVLFAVAYGKAGEYGAPPSLFFIQEQETADYLFSDLCEEDRQSFLNKLEADKYQGSESLMAHDQTGFTSYFFGGD
jgi:hypothetical protein